MLFLFGTSATAIIFPKLLGSLVDSAEISEEKINELGVILLVVFAAQAIFSYFRVVLFVEVTENMLWSLRKSAYSQLIRMPMVYFSKNRVGEINSRISADLAQIGDTFTTNLAEFTRQLLIITGGIVFLFITSPKLAMSMIAVIPVVAVLAVVFGRYIRKVSREVQDKVAESNTIVEETMQGISNVKAFTNEWFELSRYTSSLSAIREMAIKGGKARGLFFSFIIFCLFGSIILLIWVAVRMERAGELTHGEIIQFMLYTVFVGASIGGIAEQYAQIQRAIGATDRLMDLLGEPIEELPLESQIHQKGEIHKGEIKFEKVGFHYPTRKEVEVLKQISFSVKSGETVAIVGPSGSGKSTLVSLVLRFYEPTTGKVIIDGKSATEYPLDKLRNMMAIVPQDVLLFGGTIRENIAYGNIQALESEIRDAAQKANALEFIESFPEKFNTVVGERGIKLSGGQRQRIAIARAVLRNPSILILDEATSSLDSESERLVQEALDHLMENRTSLVIAHRLATVRKADKIIVINHGTVVETGTHEELVKIEHGLYKTLSDLQFQEGNPALRNYDVR